MNSLMLGLFGPKRYDKRYDQIAPLGVRLSKNLNFSLYGRTKGVNSLKDMGFGEVNPAVLWFLIYRFFFVAPVELLNVPKEITLSLNLLLDELRDYWWKNTFWLRPLVLLWIPAKAVLSVAHLLTCTVSGIGHVVNRCFHTFSEFSSGAHVSLSMYAIVAVAFIAASWWISLPFLLISTAVAVGIPMLIAAGRQMWNTVTGKGDKEKIIEMKETSTTVLKQNFKLRDLKKDIDQYQSTSVLQSEDSQYLLMILEAFFTNEKATLDAVLLNPQKDTLYRLINNYMQNKSHVDNKLYRVLKPYYDKLSVSVPESNNEKQRYKVIAKAWENEKNSKFFRNPSSESEALVTLINQDNGDIVNECETFANKPDNQGRTLHKFLTV